MTSWPEGKYQRGGVQDLDTFKFPVPLSQVKPQDKAGMTESLTLPPHSQIYLRDISEQKDLESYIACREASFSNRLPEQWSGVTGGGGSADVSEAISQNPLYLCMVCGKQTRCPWLQESHGRRDGQVEPRNVGSGQEGHGHVPGQ